jgi:hypothetical protein
MEKWNIGIDRHWAFLDFFNNHPHIDAEKQIPLNHMNSMKKEVNDGLYM